MSEATLTPVDASPAAHGATAPAAPQQEGAIPQERRLVTEIPGPRSRELQERRKAVVPPGVHSVLPVYVDRAHDSIIVDVDGNHIIDVCGGIGVTTIGHTDAAVVAAATAQLGKVTHTLFTMTPYEPYVQVAEHLGKSVAGAEGYKTLLMNSGAEAVENGVKIARKFTGRPGVAVLEHAYHGRTMLTSTMNFKAAPYALGYGPRASDVYKAPNSYPLHDGLSGAEAAARTIAYLEKTAGAEDLACLVVEPIQGEGGFIVPADGYLPALAEWCRANGIVFIADEVQAGMCRTGAWFASEHEEIVPDLVTIAKGVAGGMPLSAVVGRAEIMDSVHVGGLGGTYTGNPVATAAALATISIMEDEQLAARALEIETIVKTRFEALSAELGENTIIGEVRGRGAMLAFEFVEAGTATTTKKPHPAAVKAIVADALSQGVVLLSCGTYGNVVRLLPPLTITDELLNDGLDVLEAAIRAQA